MTQIHPGWRELLSPSQPQIHPGWEQALAASEPSGGRSIAGEAFVGLQRGMLAGPSQLLSAGRAVADFAGQAPGVIGALGRTVSTEIEPYERGGSLLTDVIRDVAYPRSDRDGLWDIRGIAGDLGEAAPQVSAAIGGGLAAGPLGPLGAAAAFAGTSAAPVVGQTYQDAMREHGDPEKASIEAAANGAFTSIVSLIPGAAILRRVPGGQQVLSGAARRIVGRIGLAALAEGGQEAAEQVQQTFAEELIRRDRTLDMDLARELLTDPERLNEYLYAGTLGAVLGGAAREAVEAPRIASGLERGSGSSRTPQRNLTDATALQAWLTANPDKAAELAEATPSRAEFDRLGVPGRYEAEQRAQIVEDVRILRSQQAQQVEGEQAGFAPPPNYNPTYTDARGGTPQPSPLEGQSPFPEGTQPSRQKVIAQIARDFGVPAIRTGRIQIKGAAGVFKTKSHVIRFRSRYGGDLGVAAHEVAHFIDANSDVLKSAPAAAQQEVAKNDYDQNRLDPQEGFAEYVRYLLVGDDAPTRSPAFHQHFMGWLAQNPEVQRNLGRARAMIDQVRRSGAMEQAVAQQSLDGRPSRAVLPLTDRIAQGIGRPLRDLYRAMIGPYDAIAEMEKASGVVFRSDEASAFEYATYMNMLPGKMGREAITGNGIYSMIDPNRKIGESMREALSEIDRSELREFGAFWHAVQALEVHETNVVKAAIAQATGQEAPNPIYPAMSRTVAEGVVASVRQDPARYQRFSNTQQRMTEFANNVLKVMLEVGRISQTDYDNMTGTWTQYAPLIPAREARNFSGMFGRSVDFRDALRKRKGGDYEVVNPVLAMMAKTVQSYSQAAQQAVFNRMVDVHDRADFEGMGDFIEEVPGPASRREGIFRYQRDGQKERFFQVNRPIYDSLRMVAGMGLPYSGIEKILDWLRFDTVNRLVRAGATRFNPSFILSNIARDFVTQIVQTENGAIRAAVDLPQTVARMTIHHMVAMTGRTHNDMLSLYDRTGGNISGRLGQDIAEAQATINQVMRDSGRRKFLRISGWVGMAPFKAIAAATDGLETAPRFAEYTRTMERLGHSAASIRAGQAVPLDHHIKAINAAKDVTTDFSRGGLLGRRINRYVPFFTATLLGTDKFARTLGKHPVRTMARLSPLIAATVLLWAMKRDDDEYEEQPEWLKYGFWSFDTDGDGRTDVRIPRPHDWGWVFFSSMEATLDAIYREDPQIIKDYLNALLERAAPNLVPTPIKTGTEVYFNWDTFRNRPILNESMLRFEAEDQYGPDTTLLMRAIGRATGQSPAIMDHLADGLSGGGYSRYADFVETFDIGKFVLSGVTLRNDYIQTIGEFYQEADAANRAYQSSRITPSGDLSDGDMEKGDEAYRLNWYAGVMADLRRLVPPDAERNERFTINRYINGLARHSLGLEPLPLYPSPVGADDAPEGVRAIIGDHMRRLRERAAQNARTPGSIASRRRAQILLRDLAGRGGPR